MRREMAEFDKRFPENRPWRTWLRSQREQVQTWWFRRGLRNLQVGSPGWHILQERLSRGSSIGVELVRRNEFYMRTLPKCGEKLCIFPTTILYFPANIEFGYNVFVNRGVYIVAPARIQIGDNALIGPYVVINSGGHRYADPDNPIRDQGHVDKPIVIESDAWIGAHATILPGITIGKGAIIGAGAVVTKDVASFAVVGGVPARHIKWRRPPDSENIPSW